MRLVAIFLLVVSSLPLLGAEAQRSCKQSFSNRSTTGFIGHALWQRQADGSMTGSTEPGTVGVLTYTCTFRWAEPSRSILFDFRGARVSYEAAPSRLPGSGLTVDVVGEQKEQPACSISGVRMGGESWLELRPAMYLVNFDAPVKVITVILRLVDGERTDSLRADVKPFTLLRPAPFADVRECPNFRYPASE